MKLDLEVLASTSIKRKKPWPRFAWLGEEKESLFMVDTHRLSVLYLPSGKTKRKIPKLKRVLLEAVTVTHTKNGSFLVGLLQSGDLFLWHKDKDMLKMVHGVGDLAMNAHTRPRKAHKEKVVHKPKIYISDDATRILLIVNLSQVFLWQMDQGQNIFASKKGDIKGVWSRVGTPDDVPIPVAECKETSVSAVFMENKVLGELCLVSFVFNLDQHLTITTLLIRRTDGSHFLVQNGPGYSSTWTNIQYPLCSITPRCQAIRSRGAYLCNYANQTPVLAVAVNQKIPSETRALFFSPLNDAVVISDLKCCGQLDPKKYGRSYWIADLQWTSDDLFVACVTKHGSLCVLTRLGEPVYIQTRGCSVELGPGYYLPLHPLISVSSDENIHPDDPNGPHLNSMVSELDLMKQRYSLAVHPRFPIILCSDGYIISVISFPDHMHSLRVVKELVVDANSCLGKISQRKNIELSLIDTLKFSDIPGEDGPKTPRQEAVAKHLPFFGSTLSLQQSTRDFKFEDYEDKLNETVDSDAGDISSFGHAGQFGVMDADSGKILFGDGNMSMSKSITAGSEEDTDENLMAWTYSSLCAAWGISVSSTEIWTVEMEVLTSYVVHLMVKMFRIILHQTTYGLSENYATEERKSLFPKGIKTVLNIFKALHTTCHFDAVQQNVLPMMMRFLYGTMDVLLRTRDPNNEDARSDSLKACAALLTYMEVDYNKVYSLCRCAMDAEDTAKFWPIPREDQYNPNILPSDDIYATIRGPSLKFSNGAMSKRFGRPWYRLYRHISKYYRTLQMIKPSDQVRETVTRLLCRTEKKLQQMKFDIPVSLKWKHNRGDDLYLDGNWYFAVHLWKERITEYSVSKLQSKRASRLLHSILYTSLQSGELQFAVDIIDTLLQSIPDNQDPNLWDDSERSFLAMFFEVPGKEEGALQLPSTEYLGALEVVQTMARFMAAYFSNDKLYVYPPHAPKKLPALYSSFSNNERIIPVYHESIAAVIRQDNLGNTWTIDRTLEYLLMSGLLPEAVWFAKKMGDWKSAFVLAVACTDHQRLAKEDKQKPKKSLNLPDGLTPQAILQEKLERLFKAEKADVAKTRAKSFGARLLTRRASVGSQPVEDDTNIEQVTKTVREVLTAATISQADITSWLLQGLVNKLKGLVKKFPALVPQGFYLPAPPLYCPQPTTTSEESFAKDVDDEQNLRMQVASLVQLIFIVLNASGTALPALRWYITQLDRIQTRGEPFRNLATSSPADLESVLHNFGDKSSLAPHLSNPAVQVVLSAFRDLCTLLWILHARDKMSLSLRKKAAVLKSTDFLEGNEQGLEEDQWLRNCYSTLQWTIQMIPFTHFIDGEPEVYEAVLSQLVEFPANQESADIMVEYFYSEDTLDPMVQEKFSRIRKEWQGIFLSGKEESSESSSSKASSDDKLARLSKKPIKARRGKTLSSYFHQQCNGITKRHKIRAKTFGHFEEFVFDPKNRPLKADILHIGSRAFEIEGLYTDFIDTMFTISLSKHLDEEHNNRDDLAKPLLAPFSKEIRNTELSSLSYRIMSSLQNKNLSMCSPKSSPHSPSDRVTSTPPPSPRKSILKDGSSPSSPSTPPKSRLMMRSHSVSEIGPPRSSDFGPSHEKLPPVTPILKKKASSQTSIDKIGREKKIQRSVSFSQEDTTYFGHYPLKRSTSAANVRTVQGSEETSPRIDLKNKRSLSLSDLRPKATPMAEAGQVGAPELPMSKCLGFNSELKEAYPELVKLLDWLMRWSSKHHNLSSLGLVLEKGVVFEDKSRPAIRIRLQPFMVLLSVWLIENKYEGTGRTKSKGRKDVMKKPYVEPLELESLEAAVEKIHHARVEHAVPVKLEDRFPQVEAESEIKVDIVQKTQSSPKDSSTPPRAKPRSAQFVKKVQLPRTSAELPHHRVAEIRSASRNSDRPSERSEELLSTLNVSTLTSVSQDNLDASFPQPENKKQDEVAPEIVDEVVRQERSATVETGVSPMTSLRHSTRVDVQDLGEQLQGVIRSELRRIVEIQHRSVVAMLGAVDGEAVNLAPSQHMAASNPYPATHNPHNVTIPQTAATQTTLTLKEAGHASTGTNTAGNPHPKRSPHRLSESEGDIVLDATDYDISTGSLATETADLPENENPGGNPARSSSSSGGRRSKKTNPENSRDSEKKVAFEIPEERSRSRRPRRRQTQEAVSMPSVLHELNFLSNQNQPSYGRPQNPHSRMPLLSLDTNRMPLYNPFQGYPPNPHIPPPQAHLPEIPQPRSAWTGYPQEGPYFPEGRADFPQERITFSQERTEIPPERRGSGTYENIPSVPLYLRDSNVLQGPSYQQPSFNNAFIEIPLLHIEHEKSPILVPPPIVQQRNEVRTEVLDEFNQLQAQEQARLNYERFGHELLHVDFSRLGEAKSKPIEKNEAKRKERRIRKYSQSDSEENNKDAGIPPSGKQHGVSATQTSPKRSPKHQQASTQVTPRVTSDQGAQRSETDEESQISHDGYALSKGIFDEYLYLDKSAEDGEETSAKIQYDVFVKGKGKKVDFATNTTPRRETPDPVKQAIMDYIKTKAGEGTNILSPDIIFGLRYGSSTSHPSSDVVPSSRKDTSPGRSYINVVDIDGGMVDDIVNSMPGKHVPDKPKGVRERSVSPVIPKPPWEREGKKAQSPSRPDAEVASEPGPDATTVKMFEESDAQTDAKKFAKKILSGRVARSKSKQMVMRKLQEMNIQLSEVDRIAQNVDDEFNDARLLMNTIENLAESMQPLYPPSKAVYGEVGEESQQLVVEEPREVVEASGVVKTTRSSKDIAEPETRIHVEVQTVPAERLTGAESVHSEEALTSTEGDLASSISHYSLSKASPKSPARPPRSGSPTSKESPKDKSMSDANQLRISGLSGVSDIIGEYVAKGEIDYRAAGLSEKEAQKILKRARFTPREEWENVELSQDKLQEIFTPRKHGAVRHSLEDKKKLHEWMAQKYEERQQEFRDKRQRLKEEERQPFKVEHSADWGTGTYKEIQDTINKKENVRKLMGQEHMTRRMEMAHELMADIIHDKPKLPKEPEPKTEPIKKPVVTPEKKPAKSILRKVNEHGARVGDERAGVEYDSDWLGISGDHRPFRSSHEYREAQRPTIHHQFIHHFDHEDGASEVDSARNLAYYTQQIEHIDEMDEQDKKVQEDDMPFKSYRPKPFNQVVKMQRPEVTRKKPGKPVPYVDRLASMGQTTTIKIHTPQDLKEKEKLYGTKRVPGHYSTYKPSGPRYVKTYAERLQEMKTTSTGYPVTPKSAKQLPPDYMAQITRRGVTTTRKEPEKPRQILQVTKPDKAHTPRIVVSRIRSKKPAHKPKTYVEQLQEINANAPRLRKSREAYTPRPTKVYRSPPLRSIVRSRPYRDPYTSAEKADLESILSDYRMEDDVKRLLYDNDDDSLALGAEAIMSPAADNDRTFDYLPYTSLVDVQELVDAVSVSEGSIMSYIDWDAVDNLIADVH